MCVLVGNKVNKSSKRKKNAVDGIFPLLFGKMLQCSLKIVKCVRRVVHYTFFRFGSEQSKSIFSSQYTQNSGSTKKREENYTKKDCFATFETLVFVYVGV